MLIIKIILFYFKQGAHIMKLECVLLTGYFFLCLVSWRKRGEPRILSGYLYQAGKLFSFNWEIGNSVDCPENNLQAAAQA